MFKKGVCMHKAKLCLGTVQLGIKYGVNNVIGRQPTKEEAFALLSAAQRAGVDTFDTDRRAHV